MALETIIPIIIILLIGIFLWGIFKRIFKVFFYVEKEKNLLVAVNFYFI
jgi:hypothetical protein